MSERMGLGEYVTLVKDYARQETIEPLRGIGRWVAFGVAGSLLLMVAGVSLTLALLRFLQEETGTRFTGNWSWAPYAISLAAVGLVLGLLTFRITKRSL
ncbi:MAG: hypothetical protein R2695_22280 [Acidimicrobiales bacterium]